MVKGYWGAININSRIIIRCNIANKIKIGVVQDTTASNIENDIPTIYVWIIIASIKGNRIYRRTICSKVSKNFQIPRRVWEPDSNASLNRERDTCRHCKISRFYLVDARGKGIILSKRSGKWNLCPSPPWQNKQPNGEVIKKAF